MLPSDVSDFFVFMFVYSLFYSLRLVHFAQIEYGVLEGRYGVTDMCDMSVTGVQYNLAMTLIVSLHIYYKRLKL